MVRKVLAATVFVSICLAAPPIRAQDFYAGKTLTIVIGYGVNNGYDSYARAIGRHIGDHLRGKPTVVPQNMPGAGGLAATSYLYNAAARDGTVIGMIDQATPLAQTMGMPGLRADVTKFNWIGRIVSNAAILFARRAAKVQNLKDAYEKELIVATPGQSSRIMMTLLRNMLGMKLRILTGYPNSAESLLAMERGEIDAGLLPWPVLRTEKPEWLREKKINLLAQMGTKSPPDLRDVPVVSDFARNDEERKILDLMTRDSQVGRAIMAPPGMPPERVADLRAAFNATIADEAFRADLAQIGLDLDPLSGVELQQVVATTGHDDPTIVERAKALSTIDK